MTQSSSGSTAGSDCTGGPNELVLHSFEMMRVQNGNTQTIEIS